MRHIALTLFVILSFSSLAEEGLVLEADFEGMSQEEIATLTPESIDFKEPEVMGAENFSVERVNGRMHIGFDIVIKNPNRLGFVIKPSSLFLKIAGVDMGWVRVEEKIKIKRKSEAGYPFALVGNSGDFVKSAFSSIWSLIIGEGVDFNMAGTVKAGVFFFKKKWKVDFTYKMTNDEFMSLF